MKPSGMIYRTATAFIITVIVFITTIPAAYAKISNQVYVKAQFLSMKEFDDKSDKILEESGALFGVGYKLIPERDSSSLRGDGEIYFGVVDYDGQSENGNSFKDKNKYLGLNLDGNMNFFLCNLLSEEQSLMAMAGLGIDSWIRSINLIHKEYGYREIWTNFYGRVGLGTYLKKDFYVSGGLKIPFWTSRHIGDFDLDLNPKRKTGVYIETSILIRYFSLYFFYESNRFQASHLSQETGDQYYGWQPDSKGRNIGFSLRYRF